MRIFTSAAALAVGGSLVLAGLIAPAAQAAGADQECRSLGVANLYGEFIKGDDTHTPDAEGAVAVGGNANFTGGFSAGQELTTAEVDALPGKNALVVAGKLTGRNTQVMKGNGVYGSEADGAVVQAHGGAVSQGASPIDFEAEFAKLRAASTALAAVPQTAGATVQADGPTLTFTGTDAKYNSFTVDAGKLQGAKEIYLKVPTGAVTVVNVTGGAYDMATAGTTGFHLWDEEKSAFVLDDKMQSAAGGAIRAKLLWNFPSATKVAKNSQAAWAGTVLAPDAAFDLGSGGPVNGSVIAASLTGKGSAETHHYPFTGCLPGTTVPTPTGTPTIPPVTPSGSPTAPVTPSASTSSSGTPSVPGTGKPGTSASASPGPSSSHSSAATAAPSASASPPAQSSTGDSLAHTGSGPVLPLAIGGAVVLAAGGGIVLSARRKAARKA